MTLWPVRHISLAIARSPQDVYAFASDPMNLPAWASGLARSVQRVGGAWIVESPAGQVALQFAPRNELGVLDHDATLPSGRTIHNAMRVLPNSTGSEVVFSLFHLPEVSDATFEQDARTVARDLQALKRVLER